MDSRTCPDRLVAFYNRSDPNCGDNVFCQVLNGSYASEHIIGAHVWKHATRGNGLEEFGLQPEDVDSPRNGLVLAKAIGEAFDPLEVCFLYNFLTREIVFHIVDPLMDKLVYPSTTHRFHELEGAILQVPQRRLPFRRLLAWHAIWALHKHGALEVDDPDSDLTSKARCLNVSFGEQAVFQGATGK